MGLTALLPLLLGFLESLATNRHSAGGAPQAAELLARIGALKIDPLKLDLLKLDLAAELPARIGALLRESRRV